MENGTAIRNLIYGENKTLIGSVILTVGAIIASWPATAFLLMYYRQPQDTGALMVGGLFSLLAVVLWGSAGWGWSKIRHLPISPLQKAGNPSP